MSFNCNHYFTYVLHVIIWTSLKDMVRVQEKARTESMPSRRYYQKKKRRNKTGVFGSGLFVVVCF